MDSARRILAQIVGSGMGDQNVYAAIVRRLTGGGHEFLGNAKNETVWRRTMTLVQERGESASMAIVRALATKFASEHFGLSL